MSSLLCIALSFLCWFKLLHSFRALFSFFDDFLKNVVKEGWIISRQRRIISRERRIISRQRRIISRQRRKIKLEKSAII